MQPTAGTPRGRVLLVDDDPELAALLVRWIELAGHSVDVHADAESCLRGLADSQPDADAVVLDLNLPGMDGLEALERIRRRHPRLPVIVSTVEQRPEKVVAAMKLGAHDYLTKPLDRTRLLTELRNAIGFGRMSTRVAQLEHEVSGWHFPGLVGRSETMLSLFRQMDEVAAADVTVLVEGESGTGKELVARAIHHASGRRDGSFVAVNCAAIPETLQETELFGHEKGAFTGAVARKRGRFEQADGGTLFLDEVEDLSLSLQAKLLRAIQERSFHRVGGAEEIRSDFRLLAACHGNLLDRVEQGLFRRDLYYRFAVFELLVPPLRERHGDVRLLAEQFARDYGLRFFRAPAQLAPATLRILDGYDWPGNVRELQNVIQRAVVASRGGEVGPKALPVRLRPGGLGSAGRTGAPAPSSEAASAEVPAQARPVRRLEEAEREVLRRMLDDCGGNLSRAARELGISRTTLYRKLDRLGLARRPGFVAVPPVRGASR